MGVDTLLHERIKDPLERIPGRPSGRRSLEIFAPAMAPWAPCFSWQGSMMAVRRNCGTLIARKRSSGSSRGMRMPALNYSPRIPSGESASASHARPRRPRPRIEQGGCADRAQRRRLPRGVFVLGDVGPSGELLEPMGTLTAEAAQEPSPSRSRASSTVVWTASSSSR